MRPLHRRPSLFENSVLVPVGVLVNLKISRRRRGVNHEDEARPDQMRRYVHVCGKMFRFEWCFDFFPTAARIGGLRPFYLHQWLDVKDTVGKWYARLLAANCLVFRARRNGKERLSDGLLALLLDA